MIVLARYAAADWVIQGVARFLPSASMEHEIALNLNNLRKLE
jgi:hypothetical protein